MRRQEARGKRAALVLLGAFALVLGVAFARFARAEPVASVASASPVPVRSPVSAVVPHGPPAPASGIHVAPTPSAAHGGLPKEAPSASAGVPDAATSASAAIEEPAVPSAVLVPLPSELPPEPEPPPVVAAPPAGPGEAAPSSSAAPAPSSSAGTPSAEAGAKIHDTVVFTLRRAHGEKGLEERARAASEALEHAVETPGAEDVRVERHGDSVTVYAGQTPIVDLYAEDAEASGYSTVETLGAAVGVRVRAAITEEKKRSALASTVFSFSLAIFFGLIAFYVLRKVSEFFDRARKWAFDDPDRIKGIRFQSQLVVGPAALRGAAYVALILGRWMAQIGVVYLWLVFALSLFQTTRPYTEKLTGFVVTPLSSLAARFAASLPLAVVAAVSGVALFILLRFAQLFFEGVERKQTELSWLPADLAAPTSVLVRSGILVTGLVFIAPIVTGDQEGAVARTGTVALFALGLSCAPLLASVIVGILVVYGRRVRVGQHAELGAVAGKVLGVGLVDVRLLDGDGCEVRVPHLLSLVRPMRVLGARPRFAVDIAITNRAAPAEVRKLLTDAAEEFGEKPTVELVDIDRDGARYRVAVSAPPGATPGELREVLVEALAKAGLTLGRASRTEPERV